MIFKLSIICIIVLALIYYIGIVLQCLFPSLFHIADREITFLRAIIPFYYWTVGKDKKKQNKKKNQPISNNNQNHNQHE